MSASHTCPNCRILNPPDAVVCDCGYDFGEDRMPVQSEPERWEDRSSVDSVLERNAGKILIAAFLVPMPVNCMGSVSGEIGFFVVGSLMFVALVILSIVGFQLRRRR